MCFQMVWEQHQSPTVLNSSWTTAEITFGGTGMYTREPYPSGTIIRA